MSGSQEQQQNQGSISPQLYPEMVVPLPPLVAPSASRSVQWATSPTNSPSAPPPLPMLSATPSVAFAAPSVPSLLSQHVQVQGRYQAPLTKLCLVKKALKTLIDNAHALHKGNKIVIFLFDHECVRHEFTMSDEGYAEALRFVQRIHHRGSTNIIKVCHDMIAYVNELVASGISLEDIMNAFLTDGIHYDKETTIKMLIEPDPIVVGDSEEASAAEALARKAHATSEQLQEFFDHVGGIGSESDIDTKTLEHFEGGRSGVYDRVETEQDVLDIFTGKYFNLLTAHLKDGEVKIWFLNDGSDIPLDEATTTYYTDEEFQQQVALVETMITSDVMSIEHSQGSYVVKSSVKKEEVRQAANTKTFCLGVDISGSMGNQIRAPVQAQAQASLAPIAEQEEKDEAIPKLYGCHTFKLKSITPDTELPGKAKVLFATLKATNVSTKETTLCRLPVSATESEEAMELRSIIFDLYRAVKMPLKKRQIKALYKDNLFVPELLKNASSNLRTIGEVVWTAIKNRYFATLNRGEQVAEDFMDRTPAYLPMLAATSSNAAAETPSCGMEQRPMAPSTSYVTNASGTVVDVTDDTKCQICFEKDKSIMFIPCRHIGMCQECFVDHIKATVNTKCPFCRQIVERRVNLDLSKGTICRTDTCHQQYQYVCEQGHGLYCKDCISTHMTGSGEERRVICPDCPDPSKRVRLYVM